MLYSSSCYRHTKRRKSVNSSLTRGSSAASPTLVTGRRLMRIQSGNTTIVIMFQAFNSVSS
jgi:hypothetical protein